MSGHQMLSVDTLRIAIAEYVEKNAGLLEELGDQIYLELEKYATEPLNWVRQNREIVKEDDGTTNYVTSFVLKHNPKWILNKELQEALSDVAAEIFEDGNGNILDTYIYT